jgi:hypothetical protein
MALDSICASELQMLHQVKESCLVGLDTKLTNFVLAIVPKRGSVQTQSTWARHTKRALRNEALTYVGFMKTSLTRAMDVFDKEYDSHRQKISSSKCSEVALAIFEAKMQLYEEEVEKFVDDTQKEIDQIHIIHQKKALGKFSLILPRARRKLRVITSFLPTTS